MTYTIRLKNSIEDMAFFNELDYESFKSTLIHQVISEEETRQKYEAFQKADPIDPEGQNHFIFILENEEGFRCGLIWICNRKPFWRFQKQHLWIYNLHIIPEHQGKGLAQILMLKAEEWAKKLQLNNIALHVVESNHIARHIYEKLGYELVATHNESCFYEKNIN